MISSVPSHDEELLNSAYANIGLIADKGWAYHQDDPFRKLNHTLWVQNCKLSARYRENGNHQPRFVRDAIPGSLLARYGDYEYNEERERMYKPGDNTPFIQQPDFCNAAITEPWMLEEVEEHFARLNSRSSLPLDDDLSAQMPSSINQGLDFSGKLSSRETGRFVQSRWDAVSKKRYSTLEQVLATKNYNVKDNSASSATTCTTNIDGAELHYKNVDPEDYIKYPPLRYTVDNMAEMQLQIQVTSDAVRDLWNPSKPTQQHQHQRRHFQYSHRQQQYSQSGRQQQQHHNIHCSNKQQQYIQCGMQHQSLAMSRPGRQSSFSESVGMMRQPPLPILSAEVPEFFPKGPINRIKGHQEQTFPLQFFPSSTERSYQDELFPYNRGHVPASGHVFQNASIHVPSISMQQVSNASSLNRQSHQWIQRPNPALHIQVPVCPQPHQSVCTSLQPVCPTIIQRRIQMHDKIAGNMIPAQGGGLPSAPIPVYQRPPELYNDPSQRRKNQGVDFNNLILLTKNAMKARRNQSKNSQQSSSFVLESKQPNLKSETDVLQWLEKGYPKRAEEFVAVNILVSDFRNLEEKCDERKTVSLKESNEDIDGKDTLLTALDKSPVKSSDADTSSDLPTKRRLYRDVLTNSSSTGIILENVFDKRYDELERQAMEQYRTSEECLALRYQELERQAMEQYRNCDNSSGNTSTSQSQSSSPATPAKGKPQGQGKSVTEDKDQCVGGHKCSGFGHCSPIKDSSSASEKGTPPHQPITILRPENKPAETSVTKSLASDNKYSRPTIVTKSPQTTTSQRSSHDSKNTTRGASGDKIDRTVKVSSKRRLILMSPSKRESEARPRRTSDLEATYNFQSMNGYVSGSYRKSEVVQTGGGDENVTILRSPGAEGIRKQLFLTNEELMDSYSESLGVRLLEPIELSGACRMMDFVTTLKEQTIGVSPGKYIATIKDAVRKVEQGHSVSGLHRKNLNQRGEYKKNAIYVTRNKTKKRKPHNIDVMKEPKCHHPNVPAVTTSINVFPRDEKYHVKLVDVIPNSVVLSTKIQRTQRKPSLKLKLKSGYQKMFPSPHFQSTKSLAKWNYLTLTDFLPKSLSIVQTAYCYVSIYNTAQVDATNILISNDSYLSPKQFGFETNENYFEKKVCSQNFLTVRYCATVLSRKRHKLSSLNPLRVVPTWDNSDVDYLQQVITSETTPRRCQADNLSSANNCTRFYAGETKREADYFDLFNIQIFPLSSFIPIVFDGKEILHLYSSENIY